MEYLIDTSAFIRFLSVDDPLRSQVAAGVANVWCSGATICFTPQVAREAWAVLTRPQGTGGYGLSLADASILLDSGQEAFHLRPDPPATCLIWLELVKRYQVSGKQVHDAYLVASMLAHSLSHVLTLNGQDFKRYQEVVAVDPTQI